MTTINEPNWTLDTDLAAIMAGTQEIWPALRGARIFLTGKSVV